MTRDAQAPRERHVIGGVAYVPVGSAASAEQDVFLLGCLRRAGVDELLVYAGEDKGLWARRILYGLAASGDAMLVLGALYVPEDVGPEGWTPEGAAETARALGAARGERDKQAVFGLLQTNLVGFLETGLVSCVLSRTSSTSEEADPGEVENAAAAAPGAAEATEATH